MKRSKYNVSRSAQGRTFEGVEYDSAVEMRYYRDFVRPRLEDGSIVACESQVPFVLQEKFTRVDHNGKPVVVRPIVYVADYVLTWSDGRKQVIDIKGCANPEALMKRKMFWRHYPELPFLWISWSKVDGGWVEYEDLKKARAARRKAKANRDP